MRLILAYTIIGIAAPLMAQDRSSDPSPYEIGFVLEWRALLR